MCGEMEARCIVRKRCTGSRQLTELTQLRCFRPLIGDLCVASSAAHKNRVRARGGAKLLQTPGGRRVQLMSVAVRRLGATGV